MTSQVIRIYRSFGVTPGSLLARLFVPVDAASLVLFRIAFGAVMLWEIWRFYDHDWVGRYFTDKAFYFKYWPFDFVQPWPGDGMYIHFGIMAFFAACIVLGLFYRFSATAFFLMFTYVFLLEQARYLNHLYLVCLIAFLMIFVPAHRSFSLDAWLRPGLRSDVVPAWSVWLLRFQVAIPMFFGGIAKLNGDWLRGEPMRAWLADRTDFPVLGNYFTEASVVWLFVYGGLLIDFLFPFYLINRRTRVLGFLAVLTFHFINNRLFGIGIFPWLMIASTLIFFTPDWPRRLLTDLRLFVPDWPRRWAIDLKQGLTYRNAAFIVGFILGFVIGSVLPHGFSLAHALIGAIGVGVAACHLDEPIRRLQPEVSAESGQGQDHRLGRTSRRRNRSPGLLRLSPLQTGILALLALWIGLQVVVPLRHFAIPGKVHWTEEGHKFSWHMKLRDKDSVGFFVVTDPATGEVWEVEPDEYLNIRQESKMTSRPDMVVEFAKYLEEQMREEGYEDVEVRANIYASLNGREDQLLIDPNVDLTRVSYPWAGHADWILPLEMPFRSSDD